MADKEIKPISNDQVIVHSLQDKKPKKSKGDPSTHDIYEIFTSSLFYDIDDVTLHFLYLPIMGADAIILYKLLFGQILSDKEKAPLSHSFLLAISGFNEQQFINAKDNLETYGLLSTYILENEGFSNFYYVLNPPYTPKTFFDHFIFDQSLFQKIGEQNYNTIKSFFQISIPSLSELKEVTKDFDTTGTSFKLDVRKYKQNINDNLANRNKINLLQKFIQEMNKTLEIFSSSYKILNDRTGQHLFNILCGYNTNYVSLAKCIYHLEMEGKEINKDAIEKKLSTRLKLEKKTLINSFESFSSIENSSNEINEIDNLPTLNSFNDLEIELANRNSDLKSDFEIERNDEISDDFSLCKKYFHLLFTSTKLTPKNEESIQELLNLANLDQVKWILIHISIKQKYFNKKYSKMIATSVGSQNPKTHTTFLKKVGVLSSKNIKQNIEKLKEIEQLVQLQN